MTNGNSAERERFEAWFKREYSPLPVQTSTGSATWKGWQAALSVCADGGKDSSDAYRLKVANDCCDRLMQACSDAGCPDGVRMDDWIRENVRADGGKGEAVEVAEVVDLHAHFPACAVVPCFPIGTKLYAAPQAIGKGEAVAWLHVNGTDAMTNAKKRQIEETNGMPGKRYAEMFSVPLYTAPQAECAPRMWIETAHFGSNEPPRVVVDDECAPRVARRIEREDPFDDAPREAQPVAFVEGDEVQRVLRWNKDVAAFNYGIGTALYAAPMPERAQESAGVLSDDQIREIWMRETGTTEQDSPLAVLDFARAVIAADKEPQP